MLYTLYYAKLAKGIKKLTGNLQRASSSNTGYIITRARVINP